MNKKNIISFFIILYLFSYSTTLLIFIILIKNSLYILNYKYECAINNICQSSFFIDRELDTRGLVCVL